MILYLVLQEDVIGGCLLEGYSEVSWDDDVDDIDLLDIDSQFVEPHVEFSHHLGSELRLDVSDFVDFDLSDEVSDAFLRFLL